MNHQNLAHVDRSCVSHSKRWVVKIGTALIADHVAGLNREAIAAWVSQIIALRKQGIEVILVTSGAVGIGMKRFGWDKRPDSIHKVQAAASVGQMVLVKHFQSVFNEYNVLTAQILLTHADFANRESYLNAKSTMRELLQMGVIPIINENDAVVSEQTKFGDNDTLAALMANLLEAPTLVLLTDQEGLYDADPRSHSDAAFIQYAMADDPRILDYAGTAGSFGRGGMQTKVTAARKAARSGAATVIANGRQSDVLLRLRAGEQLGTILLPGATRMAARKQWLAGHLRSNGFLQLDAGAAKVIKEGGKSLLPIGVVTVSGDFHRGDIVRCVDPDGREIAIGLVNYSSEEARKIIGHVSGDIESILGYLEESELIHRDNLALTS